MTIYTYKNYNNNINEASVEFYHPVDETIDLKVKIISNKLFIRNVENTKEDREIFYELLMDPINTAKYGEGVQSKEYIDEQFDEWIQGWKNKDVCSGMMVFDKFDHSKFIGHIMLMHSKNTPGEAELAIILQKSYWGKGLGGEMMDTIVHCFSDAIKRQGYLISTGPGLNNGKQLFTLYATARVDNHGSCKIIQNAGLAYYHQQILYGAERKYFRLDLN